ncbi:hypothetical protein BGX38DRAFT_1272075 [Terfezia claveryi]|nr:hypothetical protein BGX38DRAFT_1272075 [Terfezia claveryi]
MSSFKFFRQRGRIGSSHPGRACHVPHSVPTFSKLSFADQIIASAYLTTHAVILMSGRSFALNNKAVGAKLGEANITAVNSAPLNVQHSLSSTLHPLPPSLPKSADTPRSGLKPNQASGEIFFRTANVRALPASHAPKLGDKRRTGGQIEYARCMGGANDFNACCGPHKEVTDAQRCQLRPGVDH